jgi:nucleoside-diphosphate-sugar epimerase
MLLKNKTILITGADRFIGSYLTEALVNEECKRLHHLLKDAKILSFFCHSGQAGIFPMSIHKDARQAEATDYRELHRSFVMLE